MPTYLIHGFRWHRAAIRIHIILQDLEDAAAEWIIAPASARTLLDSFYAMYDFLPPSSQTRSPNPIPVPEKAIADVPLPPLPPIPLQEILPRPKVLSKKNTRSMSSLRSLGRKKKDKDKMGGKKDGANGARHERNISGSDASKTSLGTGKRATNSTIPEKPLSFNDWSAVKLVEQYDPNDLEAVSQPYAYVADYIVDITLSASISEEMMKYEAKVRENEGHSLRSANASGSAGTPEATNARNGGDLNSREARGSKNAGWFEKLRDGLQKGEAIGWYVVVCGDEERRAPSIDTMIDGRIDGSSVSESEESEELARTPKSSGGGFRGFFKGKKSNAYE